MIAITIKIRKVKVCFKSKCFLNFQVPHLAGKTLDVPKHQFPVPSHGGDGGDVVLVTLVDAELRNLIRNCEIIF